MNDVYFYDIFAFLVITVFKSGLSESHEIKFTVYQSCMFIHIYLHQRYDKLKHCVKKQRNHFADEDL